MKAILRLVLLGLVLVVVAMVSALTAMRFAIHGREVAVPKLVGMTPADAARSTAELELQVDVERKFYSANVAEGRIMSQVPAEGTMVRRGWSVRVAESLGPQRVTIPDVLGESERAATLNLRRRGLELGSVARVQVGRTQEGQVLGQNPAANAGQVTAPSLSLLVANAAEAQAYAMPNFVGQTLGAATQALRDAGMKLGSVTVSGQSLESQVASTTAPALNQAAWPGSVIVAQTPKAGEKVVEGATVNLEVK
jgi:eukaryotic-like serine/threonine-protein kinase